MEYTLEVKKIIDKRIAIYLNKIYNIVDYKIESVDTNKIVYKITTATELSEETINAINEYLTINNYF